MKDVTTANQETRSFLSNKAKDILEDVADGVAPVIMLPASLLKPDGAAPPDDGELELTRTPTANKPKTGGTDRGGSKATKVATNPEVISGWKLPGGTPYANLFTGPSPNLSGWPILTDSPRLKNPKPMCIGYQATGTCHKTCFLAHTTKRKMMAKEVSVIGARFKEIYM
jgi:hypothetical protein